MITSAGGVIYRVMEDGVYEVKLITTKSWRWSLPKGKLEINETIEACAIRECKEEAGVDVAIECFLGCVEWKLKSGDFKQVHIYLMKAIKDGQVNDPDKEILNAEWKTLDEAISLVDFPPMRKMLIYAVRSLHAEKASLCTHCFNEDAVLLDWCEDCLVEAKKHLELKYAKKALKRI